MSKRIFWVAYDLDRAAAFTLGRPFGIPDEMIDVELPLDVDDADLTANRAEALQSPEAEPKPTTMTGAIHVIKLRRIWSMISSSIYPATPRVTAFMSNDCAAISAWIPQLRQYLDEWKDSIPRQLANSTSGSLSVFTSHDWFQLAYHHSIILLYRHSLSCGFQVRTADPPNLQCTKQDIDHAYQECFTSAREMCLLYRRTYQLSSVRYTWGSLHILFLGGLTYLHCLWTSEHVRRLAAPVDVISTCTACNMVLVIIAERWEVAASYRDLFEKLSERTINMICGALQRPSDLPVKSSLSGGTDAHDPPPNPDRSNSLHQKHSHAGLQQLAPSAEAAASAQVADVGNGAMIGAGFSQFHDPMLPQLQMFDISEIDDWIMGLEDMNVPDESQWLVQDMIRGFGGPQARQS